MFRVPSLLALPFLASLLAGCGGGGVTPDSLPPEQKAPEYGQASADKMKSMIGVPGPGGKMQTPK